MAWRTAACASHSRLAVCARAAAEGGGGGQIKNSGSVETGREEGARGWVKLSAVDQRLLWCLPDHQTEMGATEDGGRTDPRAREGCGSTSLSSENVYMRDSSEPAKNKALDLQCHERRTLILGGTGG